MQLNKFIIPKEFLDSMSEDEKMFAVQLGYFVNELNMLYKCIRIPKPKSASYGHTPEEMAHNCFVLMFIRLLAGKLYEAWKMVKTFEMSPKESRYEKDFINKELPKWLEEILSTKTKDVWEKIDNYFKDKKNNLKFIRNKAGFHYDKELIEKGLGQLKALNEKELIYFTSDEYDENNFYAFSENIFLYALKEKIVCSEGKDFLLTLLHETGGVCDWFSEFGMNCLGKIAEENKFKLKPEIITILNPPTDKELNFPFFIQRDERE
jgi:hypothetical protein